MKLEDFSETLAIMLAIAVIVGTIVFVPLSPLLEANTYNRLMCPEVPASYLDALFSELRVDGTSACDTNE